MRVNLHIGMHFSRTSRLVKAVRLNEANFARGGVLIRPVKTYRARIEQELTRLDGLPPTREECRALLQDITGGEAARGIVMIEEAWSGEINSAFEEEMLYATIGENVHRVVELFQTEDVHLSLALINPATYVAGVLGVQRVEGQARWFVRNVPPENISWRLSIDRLLAAVPDIPVTIWAEEDAPLIWSRVLRQIGGLSENTPIRAPYAALREMLAPEGMARFKAFIEKFPPKSSAAEERAIMAFLDKYDAAPVLGPEGGIDGWDDATLATITARYEADIAALAEHPRITMIQPYAAATA